MGLPASTKMVNFLLRVESNNGNLCHYSGNYFLSVHVNPVILFLICFMCVSCLGSLAAEMGVGLVVSALLITLMQGQ